MARSAVILREDAQRFRQAIRPSLFGNIAKLEPGIAADAAEELYAWLFDVIQQTVRTTTLNDRSGEILRQLRSGVRITGRTSLASLRGAIWAQPWLFAHEYGARIEPREAQYLAIPIHEGLRPDGTPKFRSPRAWNRYGSFVYTNKRTGKKYLAYRNAAGKLLIIYILVDHADIPARLGLNRMGNAMLGRLMQAWGTIYLQHVDRAGIINLWGATR